MSQKVILALVDSIRPDGFTNCRNPFSQKLLKKHLHFKGVGG